ncbi:hypothetical protein ACIF8T_30265 [Streptomyces sp. NPDC085946]|uniref:hypothetical protein n=1 Tax=Streptomyces sp. NPDC085946 TaxID=3365744 RepID=UPI0037D3163D
MNLAPQVETAEISDAELDGVSGGQAGVHAAAAAGAAAGLHVEAGPLCLTAGAGAAVSPEGVAADVHLHASLY